MFAYVRRTMPEQSQNASSSDYQSLSLSKEAKQFSRKATRCAIGTRAALLRPPYFPTRRPPAASPSGCRTSRRGRAPCRGPLSSRRSAPRSNCTSPRRRGLFKSDTVHSDCTQLLCASPTYATRHTPHDSEFTLSVLRPLLQCAKAIV